MNIIHVVGKILDPVAAAEFKITPGYAIVSTIVKKEKKTKKTTM
jgi:hypothetical protein